MSLSKQSVVRAAQWSRSAACAAVAGLICMSFASVAGESGETGDYVHYRLAVKYKQEKNYDLAVEEFRKVLAAYPDNYNAYMHLAEIRREQKQARLVIYDLKQALTYNPGWGKAHRMLAEAYEGYGQYQNAIVELQLYQQACDPAERDSVQAVINSLVSRLSGEGGAPAAAAAAPAAPPEAKQKQAEGEGAAKAAPARRAARVAPERAARASHEFELAVKLYGEGKLDESLEHVRACVQLQPGHGGAYYYGGLIRRKRGETDKAKINFEKSLGYPGLGYNAHFYLGKMYAQEKQYDTAIAHLQRYIAASDYAAGKQEARSLIEQYRVAAKGGPAGGAVDIESIGAGDLQTEVEKAGTEPAPPLEVRIDKLLSMVVYDTLTDRGQAVLGGVRLFKEGRYDDAVKEFKKVLAANPTGEVALYCSYNIGVCYMKLRLFSNAENQFATVIERFPSHALAARALFLKALTYHERKDPAVAETVFREFIRKYRDHAWNGQAYERLGDSYEELENHKAAADCYEQAARIVSAPDDKVYAQYKLGVAYLAMDNGPRAVTALRSAVETGEAGGVYERVPDSHYRLADYYYRDKKYEDALKIYQTVTRKYPGFQETPWGLFQMGNVYKNLRRYDKAVETYKELIKKYPDDYWARQAQWKMEDTIWEHEYQALLR